MREVVPRNGEDGLSTGGVQRAAARNEAEPRRPTSPPGFPFSEPASDFAEC